jgi:glycosyltransferase involved in cell wall biosynthesis
MKPTIYLDIGPLQENNYTGIPAVTAALAHYLLRDEELDARFIWDRYDVPSEVVRALLATRDGRFFRYHIRNGRHGLHMLTPRHVEPEVVALFPNVKGVQGLFRREAQIVHDFSTLLFPETHHQDTIRHHALTFLRDFRSNEFTFCVSDATRTDLLTYFEMDPASVHTVPLGADEPAVSPEHMPLIAEDYIAVLGTLEPRKNLRLVLQLLQKSPDWASRFRFVFIGRFGWGKNLEEVLAEFPRVSSLYHGGRLVFTGYVEDASKHVLLRNARMLLFPSLFEGFGLPVLEAMKLGTPVVCSYSSSIPEVAGEAGFYFDPYSVDSLEIALGNFEEAMRTDPDAVRARVESQAARFCWSKFYRSIRDVIFPQIA